MNEVLNIGKINYIKIVYSDKDSSEHCIKAVIKRFGDKEIFACSKYEDSIKIPYPQDIKLNFVCEDGLYKTNTELKFIEYEEPYIFFTIKSPKNIEYQQNREYFRTKINENVILNTEDTAKALKTYDLSANGIRLIVDEDTNIPQIVDIDIVFSSETIKTKAKYVRKDNEDNILKVSFQFIDLEETKRDKIAQKCIQKQLENKRNSLKD